MKILIIGATGAAGSRIAVEALQRGHAVTAASRRPSVVAPGTTALTLDATVPETVADAARLHDMSGLDWTCLAPAAQFEPGIRTGGYRTGGADLVIDENGRSALSMEDYAIALLDEIESPTTTREVLSAGW